MGLKQLAPNQYQSSEKVNTEFESIVRYLSSAEVGGRTLSELTDKLFNDDGDVDVPIQLRLDSTFGLQYRSGEYTDPTKGWVTVATNEQIRGPAGQDVGEIGAPIFNSRADFVVAAAPDATDPYQVADATDEINYAHVISDEIMVLRNGILQREGATNDYTTDTSGNGGTGTITLDVPLTLTGGLNSTPEVLTVYKIRSTAITNYRRTDFDVISAQSQFAFAMDPDTVIQVYKNGILLREGGAADYIRNNDFDFIQLNPSQAAGNSDTVTIVTVENSSIQAVSGMMLEGTYTDLSTGLIPYNKIAIDNQAIVQEKVQGLATSLSAKANIKTSRSNNDVNDLVVDTDGTRTRVAIWNGTDHVELNPLTDIPAPTTANALKYLRVAQDGSSYQLASVDLSGLITITQKGVGDGVATLDANGKLTASQVPLTYLRSTLPFAHEFKLYLSGSVVDATYRMDRIFGLSYEIYGIYYGVGSGSLDFQMKVDSVATGQVFTASVAGAEAIFSEANQITINAASTSKLLEIEVTNASSASDLDIIFLVRPSNS